MKALALIMRGASSALLAAGITASAYAGVTFDGSPGSAAPPSTLGGYTMTPFTDDTRSQFTTVTDGRTGPDGNVTFDRNMTLYTAGSGWNNWSHGYTGDVYHTQTATVTMTLPANTVAFYFYSEVNLFTTATITATTDDGATSGPTSVTTPNGAKYFGFYATGGSKIETITVTVPSNVLGFAVGEFGINQCPPPTLTLPADITINCHESSLPSNTGTATATDDLDANPDITYSDAITAGSCPQSYTITRTWTATNDCGNSASGDQIITVQDVTAPTINLISSTIELWSPDHLYRTVNVTDFISSVTDNCATLSAANVNITRVTSDEPDDANGNGDGNTTNDIVIASNCHSVQLRSERDGNGNGRVYRIYVSTTDACGNPTSTSYAVKVRKSQSANGAAVEGSAMNTVNSACGSNPKWMAPEAGSGIGFTLLQNYPNPFSTSTVIDYTVGTNGPVQLTVVNAAGDVVATLVDKAQDAGAYSVPFNSSNLPSGHYYYVLQSNGERLVRGMTLTK
jgi:hypothetical protein